MITPEEYRHGARNKKIESVNMTSTGLMAAGSDKGDIYLWQINYQDIKQKKGKEVAQLIGTYKKHAKSAHHCEFSPDENFLFTGSVDGTASVWRLDNDNLALTDDKRVAHFS